MVVAQRNELRQKVVGSLVKSGVLRLPPLLDAACCVGLEGWGIRSKCSCFDSAIWQAHRNAGSGFCLALALIDLISADRVYR